MKPWEQFHSCTDTDTMLYTMCNVLCGGQPQTGASAGKEDPVVCGTNTQSGCLWFVSAPLKCICSNLMGNTFNAKYNM